MLVLRPILESDLGGLVALAESTGGGLTTLPPDREFLGERIDDSLRAFSPRTKRPGGESYLFALEDTVTEELVGVSGIASRVGGFDPWYSYEIRNEHHAHAPLKVAKDIPVLHLKQEHRGPTEICTLYLRADRRRGGAGRLLSLGRFLFMGAWPKRFTPTVIAEMRGYIDQTNRSPFWEAVGRHFFDFDFYAADVLSGIGQKDFIADLMPRHPLYVPLLAPAVQAAIGRVHHDTEAALALLLAEGFQRTNEVDIFDAGPQVRATAASIRTIREARLVKIKSAAAKAAGDAPTRLLANGSLDFRAIAAPALEHDEKSVTLSSAAAAALQVDVGDSIWLSPLR
jgi:arginine N-succinyltransferase